MWWKVDILRFARQLVPPVLRSKFLMAWVAAFTAPLRTLADDFRDDRAERLQRLQTTGQAGVLEWRLSRTMGQSVEPPAITVDTVDVDAVRRLYYRTEKQPLYMYECAECATPITWLKRDEASYDPTISVGVPLTLFLRASAIRDFLSRHVAAGRKWEIKWKIL